MKIIYKVGNIVDATEESIAHGCNAQGRMGSGVALAIKNRYPAAFLAYERAYNRSGLKLGQIVWAFTEKNIANCITQDKYGYDNKTYVSYEAIKECMKKLNFSAKEIAMPLIGAGLGGGDWKIISSIIEQEMTDCQPIVYVLNEKDIPI